MGTLGSSLGGYMNDTFSKSAKTQRKALDQAMSYDAYLQGKSKNILDRATTIADRPYEEYEGERVAGLSANEQQGVNLAKTSADQGREYQNLAAGQITDVANNDFTTENLSKYMNPYTEGVVNQSIKKANLAAADQANILKGQAASRGAFGGSRQTLMETQNEKNRLETIGDITTSGYSDAFKNATATWQADNQRKLSAAQGYQSVGNDITRMNSQQISDLMATGGADHALEQLQMDVDYSSFIEERDWDVNNLNTLISALGAARGNTSSPYGLPSSNTGSAAGQTIGAISAIAGYFGKGTGSNANVGTWTPSGGSTGGASYSTGNTTGINQNLGSITGT